MFKASSSPKYKTALGDAPIAREYRQAFKYCSCKYVLKCTTFQEVDFNNCMMHGLKVTCTRFLTFVFFHQKQAPGLLIPTLDFLRYEFEFERHSAYDQNKRKEIFCQAKAK